MTLARCFPGSKHDKEVIASMRITSIGICAGVAGAIILGCLGNALAVEPHESSADTRQRLVLAPAQRDMMLTEMRVMLASVSGILQGVANGDLLTAEKAARASGIREAADVNPNIKAKLPQSFLELAIRTHRGFDSLADQIKAGSSQADIIRGLATLTGNCVACHAAYRLDEAR
jgi:mono/diheme cytochrome c family protein